MSFVWVPVTLAAASFQTGRFILQKRLSDSGISAVGATYARFVWAFPLIWIWVTLLTLHEGSGLPGLTPVFGSFALSGAVSQIIATVCVVMLFERRHFAVGLTLKRTEVMLAGVFSFVLLGEVIALLDWIAMGVGLIGVLVMSRTTGLAEKGQIDWPSVVLGLAAGAFFGVSANSYRGASLGLGDGGVALRAAFTLGVVVTLQVSLLTLYLAIWEKGQIRRVTRDYAKITFWVGVLSVAGSFCWFTAFTLQNAAIVNAVGQIEVLLAVIAGYVIFNERITKTEWIGGLLIVASVLMLILV
ncbi:MAG: DMT family transporter [Pseudomonadota bacterium]